MSKTPPVRISTTQIADALYQFEGCVPYAAMHLGVHSGVIYRRIQKSELLQQIVSDKRREIVDLAEFSLRRKATDGEGWAVTFALKTLGASQGLPYNEKTQLELSGPSGGPVQTQLTVQHILGALLSEDDHLERARAEALTVEGTSQRLEGPSQGSPPPLLQNSNASLPSGNGKSRQVEAGPAPSGNGQGDSSLHPGEQGGNGKGTHPHH